MKLFRVYWNRKVYQTTSFDELISFKRWLDQDTYYEVADSNFKHEILTIQKYEKDLQIYTAID